MPPLSGFRSFVRAGLVIAGVVAALNASARPLRVAYTHWFACVPLGIAEDRQFWKEAGLQVELRGYQTSQEVIAALSDGEVDIGYDQLATWMDVALKKVPIVVVAETDWSIGGDKLLLRRGRTLTQQKGHPIAVYLRGSALMMFLRESLAREQLAIADFPIVEVPEQEKGLELFTQGKVDAVVTNEPWASRIEAAGATIVATTADFPGVNSEGFAARAGAVDDATLQKFFTAWFRAVAFLHDPANAEQVANVASIYAFAGTEAITAADVANYARITPVHDTTVALRENDLVSGNVKQVIQRFSVLRRLQGQPIAEAALANYFHLTPVREIAGTAPKPTMAAIAR
jgi:NitT/TauT family transport system substrate-binding protein